MILYHVIPPHTGQTRREVMGLNPQDEIRMAKMEAELEELKKAVHELQLKDGKTVRISPSTTWGKFIHKTDATRIRENE